MGVAHGIDRHAEAIGHLRDAVALRPEKGGPQLEVGELRDLLAELLLDQRGDFGDRRMLEHLAQPDGQREPRLDPGDQLGRQDGVATEVEEARLDVHFGAEFEQFGPNRGEMRFEFVARSRVDGPGVRRLGQRGPVDLAVGVQRDSVDRYE